MFGKFEKKYYYSIVADNALGIYDDQNLLDKALKNKYLRNAQVIYIEGRAAAETYAVTHYNKRQLDSSNPRPFDLEYMKKNFTYFSHLMGKYKKKQAN